MPIIIQLTGDIPSSIAQSISNIADAATKGQTAIDGLQTKISGLNAKTNLDNLASSTVTVIRSQEELDQIVANTALTLAKTETQTITTAQKTLQYEESLKLAGIAGFGLAAASQVVAQETAKAGQEAAKTEVIYEKLNNEVLRGAEIEQTSAQKYAINEEIHRKAIQATATELSRRNAIEAQSQANVATAEARTKAIEDAAEDRRRNSQEVFNTQQQRTFKAVIDVESAHQRLTTATNQAAASFNNAASAAINEENNLAKLNIALANQAVAQKNAINAGATPRVATTQDFQPQRDALASNVDTVQRTLSLEQQLALYRIQNEGAMLAEIRAENQLYAAMVQGLTAMQRLAQGEADIAVARSKATVAAISEAEAIARLNVAQADAAVAAQKAGDGGVSPLLSNSASFDAQRSSLETTIQSKQQLLIANQALAAQQITLGQTTLENVQVEAELAQALSQTDQAIQRVLQGEIALLAAQSQATVGAVNQQQAIVQLNIAQIQLAESLKRATDAGAAPKLSTAADFEKDRQAIQSVTEEARKNAQARVDLTAQQVRNGEVTEADIQLQLRLAQALAQTAKSANAAAHEELDLAIKRDQASQQAIKTQADQIRLDNLKNTVKGTKDSVDELTNSFSVNAGVAREFFVIFREIDTGSTTLLGGSLLVLLNRLGAATAVINGLLSPARSVIEVFSSAEVKAARLAESLAKIEAEKAAAEALAATGEAAVATEISISLLLGTTLALAAPFIALGAILYERNEQFKEFQTTLFLTNNTLGLTQKGFNQLAEDAASKSTLSIREATNTLTELARSGKITSGVIEELTIDIGKYSTVTGKSVAETTKDFIQAFAGGSDSILKFNEQFHFLTASNQTYIATHTNFIDAAENQKRAITDLTNYINKYDTEVKNTTTSISTLTKDASDLFQQLINYDLTPVINYFKDLAQSINDSVDAFEKFIGLKIFSGTTFFNAPNPYKDFKPPEEPKNAETQKGTILPAGLLAREYAQQQALGGEIVSAIGGTNPKLVQDTLSTIDSYTKKIGEVAQANVEVKIPPAFDEKGQKTLLSTVEIINQGKDALTKFNIELAHSKQDNGTGISYAEATARQEALKELDAIRALKEKEPNTDVPTDKQIKDKFEEIHRQNPIQLSDQQKAEANIKRVYDEQLKVLQDQLTVSQYGTEERKRQLTLDKLLNSAPTSEVDGKKTKLQFTDDQKTNLTDAFNKVQDKLPIEQLLNKIDQQQLAPLREIKVAQEAYNISLQKYPELAGFVLQYTNQLIEKQADLADTTREATIAREHERQLLQLSGTDLAVYTKLFAFEDEQRKKGIVGLDLEVTKRKELVKIQGDINAQQLAAARRTFDPTAQRQQNDTNFQALEQVFAAGKISADQYAVELGKLQTQKENLDLKFSDLTPFQAFITGLDQATRKSQTDNETLAKSAQSFAQGTIKGFSDSAAQALTQGKSFSESFKSVMLNLITQLESSLIQLEIQALLTGKSLQALAADNTAVGASGGTGGLLGALGGLFGGGFTNASGADVGSGFSGLFSSFGSSSAGSIDSAAEAAALGFASGGYTGDTPPDQPAGTVHGQEYVVNSAATAGNRAALEYLNATGNLPASSPNTNSSANPINVQVHNYGSSKIQVQQLSATEIRIIAKEEADKIPAQFHDANSPMSKAFSNNYRSQRVR